MRFCSAVRWACVMTGSEALKFLGICRPHDRVMIKDMKQDWQGCLDNKVGFKVCAQALGSVVDCGPWKKSVLSYEAVIKC